MYDVVRWIERKVRLRLHFEIKIDHREKTKVTVVIRSINAVVKYQIKIKIVFQTVKRLGEVYSVEKTWTDQTWITYKQLIKKISRGSKYFTKIKYFT